MSKIVEGYCLLMSKIVVVTGSRMWSDNLVNVRELKKVLDELDPDIIVHGGANGADTVAHAWCKSRGKKSFVYYPDYPNEGKGAPLKRNVAMLEDFPDATVVGCPLPNSRGTHFTIGEAKKRDMEVRIVLAAGVCYE